MREAYADQLDSIFIELQAMSRMVERAVNDATAALLGADVATAENVISADARIDSAGEAVEEKAFSLLSLQQPVAGDLRVIVAALKMVSELERMGDLSVHVAKIARMRVPEVAVPEGMRPMVSRMASVASNMVGKVSQILADRDVETARDMPLADEEMDELRRGTLHELLADDWAHGVEAAVDLALLGRYYERISDHAVSIASRVVFVVTGETPVTQG